MSRKPSTSRADLDPPDYESVHADYSAGIRTLRDLAKQIGCSPAAILAHARKHKWTRDLRARIAAKTEEKVNRAVLNAQVTGEQKAARAATEQAVIEAGAEALTQVRLGHRRDIAHARGIVQGLMQELAAVTHEPELLAKVHMMLALGEEPPEGMLRQVAQVVMDLPGRAKVADVLLGALRTAITLEREAWGLNDQQGDGPPLAVIKDYTGRGDKDSPPQLALPEPERIEDADDTPQ